MDTQILEELGLTNAEVKVYVALIELGPSSAGNIIEKSKLQNSVVHRALNSLIGKGIISYIKEGKRNIYQAADPENFYQYIEDKKTRFRQLLPDLKAKQKPVIKSEATVYKGIKGIKEIYNILINSNGKEYNTFGGGSRVTHQVMGETWWKNLHTKRIANKIKSRQIFDKSIKEFGKSLNKRPLTNIKFLSSKFEQLQETIIIKDYVAIIIFTDNPYGLLIKDKEAAKSYKKQFELLWNIAKK